MLKTIVAAAAAGALTLAASGAVAGSAAATQVGRPTWDFTHAGAKLDVSAYSLVWGDEFDGSRITANSGPGPWYAPVHADMSLGVLQAPPSEVYSVQYGVLHLKTVLSGTTWKTANIQSTNSNNQGFSLQNGYWEVRVKMPSGYGAWCGVWLLSNPMDATKPHTEFDVVEYYGKEDGRGVHTTTHIWPAPHPQAGDISQHWWLSDYSGEADLATKFHTYGVLFTVDSIIMYFDGVELKRIARQPEQQVPMYILLSNFMNSASTRLDPGDMQVDYVRAYAPKAAVRSTPDAVKVADALQVVAAAAPTAPAGVAVAPPVQRVATAPANAAAAARDGDATSAGPEGALAALAQLAPRVRGVATP